MRMRDEFFEGAGGRKKVGKTGLKRVLCMLALGMVVFFGLSRTAAAQAAGVFFCGVSGPQKDVCVIRFFREGTVDTFDILSPVVSKPSALYEPIRFFPGDNVFIEAGGCVQTGGVGSTWKRYVNPSGPNSDRLYFGLIEIAGVIAPTRFNQLPQMITIPTGNFVSTGMRLYYRDDEYGDNGYWGHDNGTGGQCTLRNGADGGPAHVRLTIVRAQPQPPPTQIPSENGKDWDLLENLKPGEPGVYDDNGLFFNPRWRWQRAGGTVPPFDKDHARNESSQPVTEDNPQDDLGLKSLFKTIFPGLCSDGFLTGKTWGHFNWFDITVKGALFWDHHDGNDVFGDDDYNVKLVTPEIVEGPTFNGEQLRAGVAPKNGALRDVDTVPAEWRGTLKAIKGEFDSDETIDRAPFDQIPWWKRFNDAVRAGNDPVPFIREPDYPGARALMDGHPAIMVGLLGMDAVHGAATEIHPVHALAVQIDPVRSLTDDGWAIFVRNWGNEGECSKDQHFIATTEIRIRLQRPEGISPLARARILPTTKFLGVNLGDASITPRKFEIHSVANGDAVAIFHLPLPREDAGQIVGELHLQWIAPQDSQDARTPARPVPLPSVANNKIARPDGGPAGAPLRPTDQATVSRIQGGDGGEEGEEEDEETFLRRLWASLSDTQRARYQELLPILEPAREPAVIEELAPQLLNELPPAPVMTMPTVSTAPATRKIARDNARGLAMCAVASDIVAANGGDCSVIPPPPVPQDSRPAQF